MTFYSDYLLQQQIDSGDFGGGGSGFVTGSGVFTGHSGTQIVHNVGTYNHYTLVTPAGTQDYSADDIATIGTIYVDVGVDTDIVYNTGGDSTVSGIYFHWGVTASGLTVSGVGGGSVSLDCADCTPSGLVVDDAIITNSGIFYQGIQVGSGTVYVTPEGFKLTDGTLLSTSADVVSEEQHVTTSGDIIDYVDAQPSSYILTGEYSGRPSATSYSGSIYIPTDGYYAAISDGSAWNVNIDGFKCTNPPDASSLTFVAYTNTNTLIDDGDGLLATVTGTNVTNEREWMYLTSVPSTPYVFEVGFDILYVHGSKYTELGLYWSDGTSNPAFQRNTVQTDDNGRRDMVCVINSDLDSWQSTVEERITDMEFTKRGRFFFKLEDDGSDRVFYFSSDCRNWILGTSTSHSQYFTPTHIGFGGQQSSTAVATDTIRLVAKIFHWELG